MIIGGLTTTPCRAPTGPTAPSIIFLSARFRSLLIAWHGFGAGRLFARRGRFFLILLLLALAYALGHYTPFFALAFDWIPGVSLYRRPADATFLINIALAFSRRIFAAPLYRGRPAAAFPHAAEMASLRAGRGDHAGARHADRHRSRLFLAGRPCDEFARRARGCSSAGGRWAPPSCLGFKHVRGGRSRRVCSCF